MTEPNWEQLFKAVAKFATLNADAAQPALLINKGLRAAGVDLSQRYEIFFDKEQCLIGLKPSNSVNAFSITRNNKNSPRGAFFLYAKPLCKKYNLSGHYVCESFERDGDMWILKMVKKSE